MTSSTISPYGARTNSGRFIFAKYLNMWNVVLSAFHNCKFFFCQAVPAGESTKKSIRPPEWWRLVRPRKQRNSVEVRWREKWWREKWFCCRGTSKKKIKKQLTNSKQIFNHVPSNFYQVKPSSSEDGPSTILNIYPSRFYADSNSQQMEKAYNLALELLDRVKDGEILSQE